MRQLQNVIRNIVVLHDDQCITLAHLPPPINTSLNESKLPHPVRANQLAEITRSSQYEPIEPLAKIEREAIERAIDTCNGNIPKAAALLEVSPSTIYRKKQGWDTDLAGNRSNCLHNNRNQLYHGYRFPPEIISHAVWLYHRFCLSFRDVEDLLAERGIVVSYETIRSWCNKFGPAYARTIKKRRGSLGDTWYMDEVFIVTVRGERLYLWRAVDQDGDVLDILVQKYKNKQAASRFFIKLMKGQGRSARLIVTDKLPSYGAARKIIMPTSMH